MFFRRVSLPHARAHTRATNTRTHSTRARARTRVHTLSRTRGSQAHAPNTREIGRGRTHARAHGNDRSLYSSRFNPPSAATFLLPRSYVLLRYLHHHHYYHHLPLFTLAHSFFPFYFSPSLSFDPPSPSPSHRRRWCCPCTPSTCPTFDVSPSEQRGRHEGSLAGNGRPEAFALARVPHVGTLDESTLELSRAYYVPPGSSTLAYFVPRKRLSSVPTVAISRTDANPLLHRHAPIFRAADSAETSHRAPRSTPAIPHSRSATRTNPPPLCRPPCAL